MKTCAFITLGCKVNQYETQAIRESLAARGFVEANPEQAADLYVINTCTVTSVSDEKSRQYIKKVRRKNPRATVVVTGCYDWLHSGHVRFFEETSGLGDLYVVVGHDANVRLLKGENHPLFPQDERQYMVQAIRYVKQALISSGDGWMDAEPEIDRIKPDMYVVNEDGDVPEKRIFCDRHNLEYVVLKRTPAEGLPRRESTALRGF